MKKIYWFLIIFLLIVVSIILNALKYHEDWVFRVPVEKECNQLSGKVYWGGGSNAHPDTCEEAGCIAITEKCWDSQNDWGAQGCYVRCISHYEAEKNTLVTYPREKTNILFEIVSFIFYIEESL